MRRRASMLVLLALLTNARAIAATGAAFYVAPTGSDEWTGTLPAPNSGRTDGPFATIPKAQEAVRQYRSTSSLPVTVFLRAGTYALNDTLTFDGRDSGSAAAPIVWRNYESEAVLISGGRAITGWEKSSAEIWTTKLPDVAAGRWMFRQLFVQGHRRTRARTPNDGFLLSAGYLPGVVNPEDTPDDPALKLGFRYRAGDLQHWNNFDDINLVLYHTWVTSVHYLASIDGANHTVQFTAPSTFMIGFVEPQLRYKRYYVENFLEALDSPGEWYLDRHTGVLSYWPMPGEDLTTAQVIAPAMRHIVQFNGTQYVVLHGISFAYADWVLAHDDKLEGGYSPFSGAIEEHGANHVTIENCDIAHVGEHGVFIEGSHDNLVLQTEIHDVGAGGVYVNSFDETLVGNVIDNCFIHDGGHVAASAYGILLLRGSNHRISHNEVAGFDNSGIVSAPSFGGGGRGLPHDNVIELNHVHDIGRGALSDLGGIYVGGGPSPGTVIRHNLVHDVSAYTYGANGIYTDEGASNITITDNVVHDVGIGYQHNFGTANVIDNNIFERIHEVVTDNNQELDTASYSFEHNIAVVDSGQLLEPNAAGGKYLFDNNLYWAPDAGTIRVSGLTFDEWKARGQDVHSSVADPLFTRPARSGTFALEPHSPAYSLGFHDIDVSNIGLYGDEAWTSLPGRTLSPVAAPLIPTPGRQVDDEDYESESVGDLPGYSRINGVGGDRSIRVTDLTAATGKHSLEFSSPSGTPPYALSSGYLPYLTRGIAYFAFDVRIDRGSPAIVLNESSRIAPPMTGPNVYVQTNGVLVANGQTLMTVPFHEWFHIEMVCPLGTLAAGTYTLRVVTANQAPRVFMLPFDSPHFSRVTYMTIASGSGDGATFFIDNVHWGTTPGRTRAARH